MVMVSSMPKPLRIAATLERTDADSIPLSFWRAVPQLEQRYLARPTTVYFEHFA
jgi:hypothetical protein